MDVGGVTCAERETNFCRTDSEVVGSMINLLVTAKVKKQIGLQCGHRIESAEEDEEGRCTLHPDKTGNGLVLGFGCSEESHASSGYELQDARTEHSFNKHESTARHHVSPQIWYDSACWVQLQAGAHSKFTQRFSDAQRFIDKNACSGRPDAKTEMFEPGGKESVLLNIDFEELHRMSRTTQSFA